MALQTPSVATAQPVALAGRKLKLGSLGVTFASLGKKEEQKDNQDVEESVDKTASKVFTEEELGHQWMLMCNRMPKEMTGLSSRMKNLLPKIADFPKVEVVVDNDILLNELQTIKGRIRATLANALGNGNIELQFRLAKVEEVKVLMTKRDVLDELKANYPGVRLLYESLGLEMS